MKCGATGAATSTLDRHVSAKVAQVNGQFFARFCENARARLRRSQELLAAGASANAAAIRGELYTLAGEAAFLGCTEVFMLARQGEGAALRITEDPAAAVACARAVRVLGRAIDAVEAQPPPLEEAQPPPRPEEQPPRLEEAPPPAEAAAEAAARGHVLLVDDSRLNAELLAVVLAEEGFAVEIAGTEAELERILATCRVDLALSDVNMPGLDVAIVCRCVREVAPLARILLISGLAEEALARACVRVCADGYVTRERGLGDVIERVISELAGPSA
jgi:CheY-like chemotaxis protein